ncbi:MAG: hypothetical protein HYX26_06935 [Acidobacteriales bacterium]|nr:hypothetical protein [Terriglobales bacterium]
MPMLRSLPLFLFLAITLSASVKTPEERLAERKARAEQMQSHERGKIYSEIARELAEIANRRFADGDSEKAQAAVQEAVSFAEKAGDAAAERGKRIKDTEINLRACARRLQDIARTLSVVDRDPVKSAADEINKIRDRLLSVMFAPKRKQ